MVAFSWEVETTGEEETESLGERLASGLAPGDLLALYGELGAGKTCLVRGIALRLGFLHHRHLILSVPETTLRGHPLCRSLQSQMIPASSAAIVARSRGSKCEGHSRNRNFSISP